MQDSAWSRSHKHKIYAKRNIINCLQPISILPYENTLLILPLSSIPLIGK